MCCRLYQHHLFDLSVIAYFLYCTQLTLVTGSGKIIIKRYVTEVEIPHLSSLLVSPLPSPVVLPSLVVRRDSMRSNLKSAYMNASQRSSTLPANASLPRQWVPLYGTWHHQHEGRASITKNKFLISRVLGFKGYSRESLCSPRVGFFTNTFFEHFILWDLEYNLFILEN